MVWYEDIVSVLTGWRFVIVWLLGVVTPTWFIVLTRVVIPWWRRYLSLPGEPVPNVPLQDVESGNASGGTSSAVGNDSQNIDQTAAAEGALVTTEPTGKKPEDQRDDILPQLDCIS